MPVRVRDLEIALVLAREMKAAAARSVDASLRLDQLQEVFGVEQLDRGERARIQTALQMAGLEPYPSLLEADPSAPIRFGATVKAAAAAGTTGAAAPPDPAEEPPADEPPTFPTVGQFARSKLGRSRRFGVRRGDHGPDHAAPALPDDEDFDEAPPPPPVEDAPVADIDPEALTQAHEVPYPDGDTAATHAHEQVEADEHLAEEPAEEPEAPEEQPEYVPLAVPEEYSAPPTGYDAYAAAAATAPPAAPVQPDRMGARTEDVLAVLLPAVAIPVIVTSVAGWRFGLPFVALMVIASGIVLSRRAQAGGARGGLVAAFRASPAAGAVLKTTALVTVLGVVASVLLASVDKDSSSKGTANQPVTPEKKAPAPAATAKPATPSKPKTTPAKPEASKPKEQKPPADKGPPADPGTEGLVRVPPKSTTQGTGPNGTGTQGPTSTQPGTGTQPSTGTSPQP
jgi:hypothetical protein